MSATAGLLAHRVDGEGEPVLLLNGGLMTIAAWEPVAASLARAHRVVRCDFRGQLLSPGEPHPTPAGHVQDVLSLLDALGLPRVHVVGTSFGAFVSLELAARHPSRVASLVVATAAERVSRETWESARPVIQASEEAANGGDPLRVFDLLAPGTFSAAFLERESAAFGERRRRIAALPRPWFHALAGLLGSLQGLDMRPLLPAIRCPALVVAAARDLTFPLPHSQALAGSIPGAGLEVVPDCGHALVVEAPERLVEIVRAFLARVIQGVRS